MSVQIWRSGLLALSLLSFSWICSIPIAFAFSLQSEQRNFRLVTEGRPRCDVSGPHDGIHSPGRCAYPPTRAAEAMVAAAAADSGRGAHDRIVVCAHVGLGRRGHWSISSAWWIDGVVDPTRR